MIEEKPPQAVSLFELLARRWTLEAPVAQAMLNASESAALFACENGTLALVQMADSEGTDVRIRVELETGRTTIRPRENPVAPPVVTEAFTTNGAPIVCRLGAQGFAVARDTGEVCQVTARGQVVKRLEAGEPVTALSDRPQAGEVVIARGAHVTFADHDSFEVRAIAHTPVPVQVMSVAPDGEKVAIWGDGALAVLDANGVQIGQTIPCDGQITALNWSPDGLWLVAPCADKCLHLIDLAKEAAEKIVDFPAPVRTAAFSAAAQAMVTSGAYRVVSWSADNLPFGDNEGTSLETGKPGLVVVDCLAAHPSRDLCAAGYATGLTTICRIGHKDEMMLNEGNGASVTALCWSADGKYLLTGGADGAAAVVMFPENMFK